MLRLVAFASIVTLSLACCRRPQPSPTTPASLKETTTKLPIKAKSPQKQAQIIIETYQDFDEKKTSIYMKAIRSLDGVNDMANNAVIQAELHAKRVSYNPEKIDAKPMNINGKFAVVFTVYDVECDQLRNFISTVEGLSERTRKVTIKCGGSTRYL